MPFQTLLQPKATSKYRDLLNQSYSAYNIFYILERQLLIWIRGGSPSAVSKKSNDRHGFEDIELPPLPTRYRDLILPDSWFVPIKKSDKRPHRKKHGVTSLSFADLTCEISAAWKAIDEETLAYVRSVGKIVTKRFNELTFSDKKKKTSHPSIKVQTNVPHHFDLQDEKNRLRLSHPSPTSVNASIFARSENETVGKTDISLPCLNEPRRTTYPIVPKLTSRELQFLPGRLNSLSTTEHEGDESNFCTNDDVIEMWQLWQTDG